MSPEKKGKFRKNPGYKKPVGKPPPCPQALCRCGHKRFDHADDKDGCFPGHFCPCDKFVLAKPAKKRKAQALPIRWTKGGEPVLTKRAARALARFGSTEPLDASMLAVSKLPGAGEAGERDGPHFVPTAKKRKSPRGLPPAEKLPTPRSKEIARLRTALSRIALVLDRDDFTLAHLMREARRIATDTLKGGKP